jgi:hypothetical protein
VSHLQIYSAKFNEISYWTEGILNFQGEFNIATYGQSQNSTSQEAQKKVNRLSKKWFTTETRNKTYEPIKLLIEAFSDVVNIYRYKGKRIFCANNFSV